RLLEPGRCDLVGTDAGHPVHHRSLNGTGFKPQYVGPVGFHHAARIAVPHQVQRHRRLFLAILIGVPRMRTPRSYLVRLSWLLAAVAIVGGSIVLYVSRPTPFVPVQTVPK